MLTDDADSLSGFGQLLRELRKAAGLTQQQLADATGVTNSYISALEKNSKPAPPRAVVAVLAENLDVDPERLWRVAQAEREARLRERVVGIPTSERTASGSLEHTVQELGTSEEKRELPELLERISALADDREEREHLIALLETIVEWLRQGS